jgi:sodium-independent sulfate anion transporter 11
MIFMVFYFSAKGKPVDANQEMFAIGVCQFAGSFFQSMPVTASFTRCAVNGASGVRTPFGGIYTGEKKRKN